MTKQFFEEFPVLWDAFERQLRMPVAAWILEKKENPDDPKQKKLSAVYENCGFRFWRMGGAGAAWVKQLEEVFFDICYFNTVWSLYRYPELDTHAAGRMEPADQADAEELYCKAVKPLLDLKKQELAAKFEDMAKELVNPLPYSWMYPVNGQETSLMLGFQNRCKKTGRESMDGYTYTFNGRTYKDVRAFETSSTEKISGKITIAIDTYGEGVIRRRTQIPTFDSCDREWDSQQIEYLMFDGKDIHLIVMRGGYRIAYLKFYEKLLTADSRMKPVFEKLGWPTAGITWT